MHSAASVFGASRRVAAGAARSGAAAECLALRRPVASAAAPERAVEYDEPVGAANAEPRWLRELGAVRNDWTCASGIHRPPAARRVRRRGDCFRLRQPRISVQC